MSLYSQNFTLLPRPARSVLSLGDEATRAQLPDFADVQEMTTFVTRLFLYQFNIPGIYTQLKVGASVVCLLIVVVVATISRRMYDKSFWIIRIMKRPSGSVIVPNAMLCYSMIEGIYGAVFVAFNWILCQFYQAKAYPPVNLPLWLLLPWCPLIVGATWAAWGTFFATPTRANFSAYAVEQRPRAMQRFFHHAIVINCLGLFIPFLICASVVVPAVISTIRFNAALRRQQVWLATYADQTQFTQQMVQDGQSIWFDLQHAMLLVSGTYVIWVFWALVMCIAYSWIAIRLILSIKHQLQKSRASGPRFGIVATTRVMSSNDEGEQLGDAQGAREVPVLSLTPIQELPALIIQGLDTVGGGNTDQKIARKASVASGTIAVNTGRIDKFDEEDGVLDPVVHLDVGVDDAARSPITRDRSDEEKLHPAHSKAEVQLPDDRPATPRRMVIPNLIMRNRASVTTAPISRDAQVKELRKAFIHICIQFFAISPACIAFMALALFLAVTSFGTTEQPWQGGILFERMLGIALVAVVWVTCLFGGITLVAIAERTYEPVFSNLNFINTLSGSSQQSGSQRFVQSGSRSNALQSPRSPRSAQRRSLMLVGNLLSPGGRRPAQRGSGQSKDRHAMSTFFETHTRKHASDVGQEDRGRSSPTSSSHRLHLPFDEGQATAADSQSDVEFSAAGVRRPSTYDDNDDREELQDPHRASLDIARRGLFIERTTVVRVEEESSDYHDATPPSSVTFSAAAAPGTSSPISHRFPSSASQSHHVRSYDMSALGAASSYDQDDSIVDSSIVASRTSDDDDPYFRGGTGRRSHTPRKVRVHASPSLDHDSNVGVAR